ncbi:hypothetical protein [Leptospira ilyithenensis]|uniref:Uncharacterized protein n=1 Tax=Leptospira ilyithenensis TaxID=2484901 RepID=A0A4R9LRW0_9LEPT|nr:hypothetical protein EHS11_06760 [Leptospira ilyithenensis]
MNEDIIGLNVVIGSVSQELIDVQKSLDRYREKQARKEAVDDEAAVFVQKAELVIEKAERGDLVLTEDQKRRIKSNLIKILNKIN